MCKDAVIFNQSQNEERGTDGFQISTHDPAAEFTIVHGGCRWTGVRAHLRWKQGAQAVCRRWMKPPVTHTVSS